MKSLCAAAEERYKEWVEKCATEGDANTTEEVTIGTNCKRSGCTKTYGGVDMPHDQCLYHPGVAVFHEGLKYWCGLLIFFSCELPLL